MAWSQKSSTRSTKNNSVGAIVCAFNEEKRLRYVLNKLLEFNLFNRIICVNDGSTDHTAQIIDSFDDRIIAIHFEKNKGKSYAMAAGVRAITSEIIFFCDADLTSIKKEHVLGVVEPVRLGLADHALAIRTQEIAILTKLTGERAVRRAELIPQLRKLEKTKFGVETFLNQFYKNKRTLCYYQPGLAQTNKNKKTDSVMGEILYADEYLKEGYQILKQIVVYKNPRLEKEVNHLTKKIKKYNDRLKKIMQTPIHRQALKKLWLKEIKPLRARIRRLVRTSDSLDKP